MVLWFGIMSHVGVRISAMHVLGTLNPKFLYPFTLNPWAFIFAFRVQAARWKSWAGKVVIYAADNSNVIRWLAARQARPPATFLQVP